MSDDPVAEIHNIPVGRSADFKIIYANHIRLKLNPSEIAIAVGYVDEVGGVNAAIESASIVLTPFTAKSLAEILTKTIALFEKQYGEIRTPSTAPLDKEAMLAIMQHQADKIRPVTDDRVKPSTKRRS